MPVRRSTTSSTVRLAGTRLTRSESACMDWGQVDMSADANGAVGTPHSVAGPPPAAGFRASVVRV